ncbi:MULTISPECIES: efflux RND transporter periplasmic adaptor subunit [unclassified Bradyrhizobium]|uniref:efflux RND transporter periplasmic adaptor subunit n=1 Tax=unclassified Bradyrhizobium TaxID=2631580 RepID=UPI001BA5C384|nr:MULTISPECIES: efflux RND transporter periplasmic adaptor subunit [unclassified Bradyrhizobium]MBR1201178.1 efflux RND transporter periplasmic adaptor subunit [Bradyrhizobium sp. AUGA SZCCT0124]MBR1316896.1 efflux RND transporter periplasmic adaptor subunit [Bradyrhizobium sp. AUGA SZCCT0051]MBR1345183.1 efflux RND transporter periplasmic adaptor subunit [Bradyrhizobium sp. AUGA SZCCT0105]MBR1359906.1 efflux RND transporter periplasmic adaptor subunit [Bradyrhizobium sp. AUGA SZCCT0045]
MISKAFKIACAGLVAAAAIGAGAYVVHRPDDAADHAAAATQSAAATPVVPVTAAKVLQHDVPIVLEGLGTVTPINTATIRTQVQGTLDSVDFVEGKQVKRGDVLAKIDPRVYEAQVDQAEAALARDEASLKNARTNLARTQPLANRGFATQQLLDTQDSQVTQGEGTVALDKAALEAAQTQLSFATITAPFDGVTGIRRIDPGNIVHPTDTNGLVVLTQLQPIAVIFTLPSGEIPGVRQALASGDASVEVYDAQNKRKLDHGSLMLLNNQVDSTTGTVQLKASFPNVGNTLWPGTFVNVHLTIAVRHDALTVPLTAVRQGPDGGFAYVVGANNVVSIRNVTTGQSRDGQILIEQGLAANETVVTAGQYRLNPGTTVEIVPDDKKDQVQDATTASAGMLP